MPASARLLSSDDIAQIERGLQERDPMLNLMSIFPDLIATLRAREAEIQAQFASVTAAQVECDEANRRVNGLILEITRRDAVIGVARRYLNSTQIASKPMAEVLAQFDGGAVVLGV
jgi:hypothetical protein